MRIFHFFFFREKKVNVTRLDDYKNKHPKASISDKRPVEGAEDKNKNDQISVITIFAER